MTGDTTGLLARPVLAGASAHIGGVGATADVLRAHLGALGATVVDGPCGDDQAAQVLLSTATGRHRLIVDWAGPVDEPGIRDETTAQAACGVMHVHGRSAGVARGLGVDFCSTAAGVVAATGLLASLLRDPDGEHQVTTSVADAALLTISQYLAASGVPDAEAVTLDAGGPPFTAADGTRFEIEALVPERWAAFWAELGAPLDAARRGWRPFQFRYATATAPLPDALFELLADLPLNRITAAAVTSGVEVCVLRTPSELPDGGEPWQLVPTGGPANSDVVASGIGIEQVTVWEAGRRIQAPLAAHVLRMVGARVVRVEPPGGDPLRGMPPMAGPVSARWLALNRGKDVIEVDLKDPDDRDRLRGSVGADDVFLHNWAPGAAERWNLTADDFADGVVHLYTSGWGGALASDLPMGTDFMVQARSGLAHAIRPLDEAPAPSLMTVIDVLGGLIGAEAALVGLLARRLGGRGVAVRSSLLGAATALLAGATARRPAGFRLPVAGSIDGVAVLDDLAGVADDPRFRAVIGRDEYGCPALTAPWRFT